MKNLYQRTFDQLQMSDEKTKSLRHALSSRCSDQNKEDTPMNNEKKILHRPAGTLIAAALICIFSVTTFAYGSHVIENIHHLITGGTIEQGIDAEGNKYSAGTVDISDTSAPIELRNDGRLYLVVNNENIDITDKCSYTKPYIYECTGEDGLRHCFIVGGDLDAIGWSEFIFDTNGLPIGGSSSFGTSKGSDDAPWFNIAKETLGLPW